MKLYLICVYILIALTHVPALPVSQQDGRHDRIEKFFDVIMHPSKQFAGYFDNTLKGIVND